MISRVRVNLMELFFTHASEMYYVREITRKVKEEINAVRRELDKMLEYGLLRSEERGNRLYYSLNKSYVFYPELLRMVSKNSGLGKKIRQLRRKLGDIKYVMFSGKFVQGDRPSKDEVEMLVVGDIVLPELELLVKEKEAQLKREVNYAVFSEKEFEFRKTRRDPFVMEILYGSKVMLIGSEEKFCYRTPPGL